MNFILFIIQEENTFSLWLIKNVQQMLQFEASRDLNKLWRLGLYNFEIQRRGNYLKMLFKFVQELWTLRWTNDHDSFTALLHLILLNHSVLVYRGDNVCINKIKIYSKQYCWRQCWNTYNYNLHLDLDPKFLHMDHTERHIRNNIGIHNSVSIL